MFSGVGFFSAFLTTAFISSSCEMRCTPECDKFRPKGQAAAAAPAGAAKTAAAAKTEPTTLNKKTPASETLAKMSGPAPSQGFEGGLVEHKNKTTSIGDWRQEYGPKGPPPHPAAEPRSGAVPPAVLPAIFAAVVAAACAAL